jgi:uncharacterized membrane protein
MGGSIGFYDAAAQIIPVLVLVLIVEQRENKRRFPPFWNLAYLLVAVFAAIVGEIVALQEVYLGRAPSGDEYWVVIPLGLLTAALVLPVLVSALREVDAEGGWRSTTAWILTLVVAFGLVAVSLAAARR